jgi:thiol-disulfide isomerase/thioredoxin
LAVNVEVVTRFALLLLPAALFIGACGDSPPPARSVDGAPRMLPAEPAAQVTALDRSPASLAGTVHGHPALVSLWASWCTACADEFPALNRLSTSAAQNGGMVVGVAVGDSNDIVREIARREQLRYTVFVDTEFKLADALGQRNVPTTLVVDRDGRIVYVGGALDERALSAFRRVMSGEVADGSREASR